MLQHHARTSEVVAGLQPNTLGAPLWLDPQLRDAPAHQSPTNPFAMDSARSGQHHAGMSSGPGEQSMSLPSPNIDDRQNLQAGARTPFIQAARNAEQPRTLPGPASANTTRSSLESAIWDWEVPPPQQQITTAATDIAHPLGYEPQGELLHEQQQQQQRQHPRNTTAVSRHIVPEFSIPHPVTGSVVDWPFSATAPAHSSASVFDHDFTPGPTTSRNAQSSGAGQGQPHSAGLSSSAGSKRKSTAELSVGASQPHQKRTSRLMSSASAGGDRPGGEAGPSGHPTRASSADRADSEDSGEASARPMPSTARSKQGSSSAASSPPPLPLRKVFPIQIGDKLFRLSGASISSDAPSYITHFFEEQLRQNSTAENVRTLYIDRDPSTFEDIALHLQGYYIEPRDGPHFVRLFADAQFFSLPRLTAQLFASPIYVRIGDVEFRVPRDIFSNPGDSPNYFSLGFAILFSAPSAEQQAGAARQTPQRPPSLVAPSIPNRSAKTFADLLHLLKGYPVEIRSNEHRQELLRDARYFHFKGLEQKLIPHEISFNLARRKHEITMRLEDIRQSGISFVTDAAVAASASATGTAAASPDTPSGPAPSAALRPGWVHYQRPYVDADSYGLIIDISGDESTYLALAPASVARGARIGRATFFRQTLARITSLFSVIASKMNLPVTQPLGLMMLDRAGAGASSSTATGASSVPMSPRASGVSDDRVKVRIGTDAHVTLNGRPWTMTTRGSPETGVNIGDESGDVNPSTTSRGSAAATVSRARSRGARRASGARQRGSRSAPSRGSSIHEASINNSDDDDDDENEDDDDDGEDWILRRSQWRVRLQPLAAPSSFAGQSFLQQQQMVGQTGFAGRNSGAEVILSAVKIEAYSHEHGRNLLRDFLE